MRGVFLSQRGLVAILSLSLFSSQNLYSMKQTSNAHADPLVLVTEILSIAAKSVSFAETITVFYFQKEDTTAKEVPTGNQSGEEPANDDDPIGMQIAVERNIPLIEMQTAKHFVKCILGLRQLINLQESISSRARAKEINEFNRLIFSGTNLATALNTIANTFRNPITNGQYYNFLFYLSFNYPKPILSSTILDNMVTQSDSDLLATLLIEDGSLLNILASFYRDLAKCQPATEAKVYELKGDLSVVLNQGKKGSEGFHEKIQRIVNLLLDLSDK